MDLEFTVEHHPAQEDLNLIRNGLDAHAVPYVGDVEPSDDIAIVVRDRENRIVGGAIGRAMWNWFYLSHLWVRSEFQGRGLGKRMMHLLESLARDMNCERAHLETFSFEARPFYEYLGYKVFAELDDYPKGHKKYFLWKDLREKSGFEGTRGESDLL